MGSIASFDMALSCCFQVNGAAARLRRECSEHEVAWGGHPPEHEGALGGHPPAMLYMFCCMFVYVASGGQHGLSLVSHSNGYRNESSESDSESNTEDFFVCLSYTANLETESEQKLRRARTSPQNMLTVRWAPLGAQRIVSMPFR